ncbi:MAG: TonB-dependent receptor [Gemmatimonadaceae bacterium]
MPFPVDRLHHAGRAVVLATSLLATAATAATAASAAPPLSGVPPASDTGIAGDSLLRPPAVIIVGQVRDSGGTPLPNVQVHLASLQRTTTTDSRGIFVFRGLSAGHYHIDSYYLGYAPGHVEFDLPVTGDTTHVVIVMHQTPLRLQSVRVTAIATGDTRTATQSTVELSGQALARNIGSTVAQTLASEPGLAMRFSGPAASAPMIRGLSGDRILVLQDGQRSGDLSSSAADHAVTIDPLAAQRVEVVRGPASLLYGNSALGGVVNVIQNDIPTEIPTRLQGYLAGQAESVTPGGAGSASITLPIGTNWAVTARGSARSLDDMRGGGDMILPNSYSNGQSGTLGVGYVGDRLNGGLAYRGNAFDYGLPAPADDPELGAHIDGRRDEVIGRSEFNVGARGIRSVKLDGTAQWYAHDEIEPDGEVGTNFTLRTQTLNALARTGYRRLSGAAGVQTLLKQYAATGDEALTPAANSNSVGAFIFQELALRGDVPVERSPSVQLGARVDHYGIESRDGDDAKFGPARSRSFTNFSGSLGAGMPLAEGVTLSGSLSRAFRAPTVEELFSNGFHAAAGSYDVGNADLSAETNTGAEAVLRLQSERLSGQFSAYYNRIDNYITPEVVGDTTLVEEGESHSVPLNVYSQADAALRGVEGQLEYRAASHLVLGVMGDLVRGDFRDGGAPLPFLPAVRVGGSARYDDGHFSVGAEARHALARTDASAAAGCPTAGQVADDTPESCVDLPTPAHTLVNLSAGYSRILGGYVHSVTVRADNLADVRYWDATSRIKRFAPNPGRNLTVVYKVLF